MAICHSKYAPGVSANLLLRHAGYCLYAIAFIGSLFSKTHVYSHQNERHFGFSFSFPGKLAGVFFVWNGKAVATILHNTNPPALILIYLLSKRHVFFAALIMSPEQYAS